MYVSENPDSLQGHFGLARLYEEIGNYTLSLKHYNGWVIVTNDSHPNSKYLLEAIRISPNDTLLRNNAGVVLVEGLGKIEEGLAHFRHGLTTDNRHPALHANLAHAYQRRRPLCPEAVRHYRRALFNQRLFNEVDVVCVDFTSLLSL